VVDGIRLTANAKDHLIGLYMKAATTLDADECSDALAAIQRTHPSLYTYIMAVPLERWAASTVATRPSESSTGLGVPSFGIATSNHAGELVAATTLLRDCSASLHAA
jgi:hypothetical protein